jgi:cysteinyl-tRNA synthetase
MDHIPIHHTNEIAQSEAAYGVKPWVKYWMHNGFLELSQGKKMAKSGDNFVTLSVLEKKGFDPLDYRYFCLGTNYRKPLMFSWEALQGAQNAFNGLKERVLGLKDSVKGPKQTKVSKLLEKYKKKFLVEVNDDLNTPKALAVMWDVLKDDDLNGNEKYMLILEFDKVLGLGLKDMKKDKIPKEIIDLINKRETAREEKNWSKADKIREEISKKGYFIEDSKEGINVRKE